MMNPEIKLCVNPSWGEGIDQTFRLLFEADAAIEAVDGTSAWNLLRSQQKANFNLCAVSLFRSWRHDLARIRRRRRRWQCMHLHAGGWIGHRTRATREGRMRHQTSRI